MESSPSDMFQLTATNLHSQFTSEQRRHSFDNSSSSSSNNNNNNNRDHFMVEDLLDIPKEVDPVFDHFPTPGGNSNSTDSSTLTVVDSCNSSISGSGTVDVSYQSFSDAQFSTELCVPYDDLAELEWLSNFVEESFSSEDLQKLHLISGMKARTAEPSDTTPQLQPNPDRTNPVFQPDMSSAPKAARSKRSRAAPGNWASCLLVLSPNSSSATEIIETDSGATPNVAGKKAVRAPPKKKQGPELMGGPGGEVRKCLHCATDKTPQWRTGPMGPKTLCNACGVRYKSGRLVPEYRPAASPTFMLTKHSNSHRKVLELRRQKEMLRAQQLQQQQHHQQQQFVHHSHSHTHTQNMILDGDDYLIHQHVGPDFRQLI